MSIEGTTERHDPAGPSGSARAATPRSGGKLLFVMLLLAVAGVAYAILFLMQRDAAEAEVIFLEGEAFVEPKTAIAVGDKLPAGKPITLGEGARCFLQLPSGVILKLSSAASVSIGKDGGQVHLRAGNLAYEQAKDAPQTKDGKVPQVVLPSGTMDVASRDFDVRVDAKGGPSRVSVYQGNVTVGGVKVSKNQGTVIEKGRTPRAVALPRQTRITKPAQGKVPEVCLHVACEPVEGASAYHWELLKPTSWRQPVFSERTTGASGRLNSPAPADGTYLLRVRAIGSGGLLGPRSETVRIQITGNKRLEQALTFARNHFSNGQHGKAITNARKGLELWPTHAELLRYLALSLIARDGAKGVPEAAKIASQLQMLGDDGAREAFGEVLRALDAAAPNDPSVKQLRQ